MKRTIPCVMICLAAGLKAQSGCPAIQFQGVAQQSGWNGQDSNGSALLRQPDGAFTEQTYFISLSQPLLKSSTANFQQSFYNCIGLPARNRTPGPPKLAVDPLGTSARNPAIIDLMGTGLPAVVGLWQHLSPNRVLVGLLNGDLSPKSSTPYLVGINPIFVLAGDFNGDGKHDVAVIYSGPDNASTPGGVSLLLGNGDGTLKPAVNYIAGKYTNSGVAWDFNGDGRTDLALANGGDNTVSIFFGNADGTLSPGGTYPVATPVGMAVADLNGDGIGDLVVGNSTGVAILYGAAGGTFKAPVLVAAGTSYPSIGTGDFNKDGKVDLVLSDGHAGNAFILLNQGNGAFSMPTGYLISYQPGPLYVEDFDGDGNLDLVFGAGHPDAITTDDNGNDLITVLFGNGDGTFVGSSTYPVLATDGTVAIPADFNGDGILDIATGGTILFGKGKGQFAPATALPLTVAGSPISPRFLAAGDFTGDGKPDLVATDSAGFIYMLVNHGNGTFATPVATSNISPGAGAVVAGDFNNDKKLDIAVAIPGSNSVSVLLGNGDGTFKAPVTIAVGHNPSALLAADLNGDGKLDLAVANLGSLFQASDPGSLTILMGSGTGTFQATSYAAGLNPGSLAVGDFNRDGKVDLIVTGEALDFKTTFNYSLLEFLGNGNGTFQVGVAIRTDFGPTQALVADFNGDGILDLVVIHCCGATDFTYLLGNGDGTFQPEVVFVFGTATAATVVDLDGDGRPDLVVANNSTTLTRSITALLNITPANVPAITAGGVLSAAAFGGFPAVAPGTWMEIYGSKLAPDTRQWLDSDFTGVNAPTSLDGVKVTIGGQLAFLDYISPGQIDAQVPAGVTPGAAQLVVTTPSGASAGYALTVNALQPGLLAPASFNIGGKQYVVAQFSDGSYVLPPGSIAGLTTRQAKPGDKIVIYGIGFGPVTPAIPPGQVVGQLNQLASAFQMSFAKTAASLDYAGLAPNFVGLYQFNVVVPAVADNDAVPLSFTLGGAPGSQTLYTAVHQ